MLGAHWDELRSNWPSTGMNSDYARSDWEYAGRNWDILGETGTKVRLKGRNWNHVGHKWFILAATGTTVGSSLHRTGTGWINTGSF